MIAALAFKCANSGERFGVLLEKSDVYRISQIDRSSEGTGDYKPLTLKGDELDFSGLYCPICGWQGEGFIKCGKCNELVCGGTLRNVELGQEFKCCCGEFLFIKPGSLGELDSFEATQGDDSGKLGSSIPLLIGE